MSPVPTLGDISFTKFTSPEATMAKLAQIVPGSTTAEQVKELLESGVPPGSTPSPLWNDLLDYDPVIQNDRTSAGSQTARDNELLRAARANEEYQYVLLWAALNLVDKRLDTVTREILTDDDGHLDVAAINKQALDAALQQRPEADFPRGDKPVTNILSLLERCQLVEPSKYGGSITGVKHLLPTRSAARPLTTLIAERLAAFGVVPAVGGEANLALAIGANTWLGLSRAEFLDALTSTQAAQTQATRKALPNGLKELHSQLRRKRQVVLQGPPGAGKTYVAREYVKWATAERLEDSRLQSIIDVLPVNERNVAGVAAEVERRGLSTVWDIVQFHPGYDYTDFVRALVATPHGSGVTFTPQHKLFSMLAAIGQTTRQHDKPVDIVLILDEINRGDIPNIFGELLYALEYRNEAVSTSYSVDGDASITVPDNLFLIGTMNTADRSIAVIDYALRRRFVFLDIAANDEPIHDYNFDTPETRTAALYLAHTTRQALADAPAGLKVGPSYFLAAAEEDESSLQVLASRFIYEVQPLLSEYEMEGEIQPAALANLRDTLGVPADVTQREQVERLVAHLKGAAAEAQQAGSEEADPGPGTGTPDAIEPPTQ